MNRLSFFVVLLLAACSCNNRGQAPLFVALPSNETGIHFRNDPASGDSLNFLDYLYYYNGGGVATGDINNDGLADIYFTANNKGGNRLYLNKGGFRFEDITAKAGVAGQASWNTGVTMADVNGDGWVDIYVCVVSGKLGLQGRNELYINNKNGSFTEQAAAYGLDFQGYSTQAAFFDYDRDGDLDCYLLTQSSHSVEMYRDTSLRRTPGGMAGDRLYRNDRSTSKAFTDVTVQAGIYNSVLGYGLGLAVADFNNDGWDDIYVGNDFHENDYYYLNQGDGSFRESGAAAFGHYSRFSMGNDVADYNNDGQLDIITADMLPGEERYLKTYSGGDALDIYKYTIRNNGFQDQYSRNALQRNLGNGEMFSETGLIAGVSATDWSWSPLFADFDNDGIKDLFISNGIVKRPVDLDYVKYISSSLVRKEMSGSSRLDEQALAAMPDGKVHNYVFQGTATGRFNDKSADWGFTKEGYSNGAAYADLDNDGRVDLVVNHINEEAGIYKNNAPAGQHWLQISFSADSGNTSAIGARAYLYQLGQMQYQQLMVTRGFQSASTPVLHFGLGDNASIDSLRIVWPDQSVELLLNVKPDELLKLRHSAGKGPGYSPPSKGFRIFEDISAAINLQWKHHENEYNDFNSHRLLPHLLSTRGPAMTTADVDGNGLDDVYICGASGQNGVLLVQQPNGSFAEHNLKPAILEADETGALFFDADGDKDQDLLIISGGNERSDNDPVLADHLYLNDGTGNFTERPGFPFLPAGKTTACAADIDKDGDQDLFIGVISGTKGYGILPSSYLLINDGRGGFRPAGGSVMEVSSMGMITAASFADLNGDNWPDLVVTGEWMDVQVFVNKKGSFEKHSIDQSSGLWQSLSVQDLDGDGDPDLLAGNYGLNSKLHATTGDPLKMYVKDFDGNGQVEQIMTYSVKGSEYTFLGKDELELQLPGMKKSFLRYGDFAGKTVTEVFGDQLKDASVLSCETLASGVFKNDGRGNFIFHILPDEAQYSPVFAMYSGYIGENKSRDLLVLGNFYGVSPYEGRYDANRGFLFSEDARIRDGYQFFSPVNSGFRLSGEVRGLNLIRTSDGPVFVVSINNEGPRLFKVR